MVIFNRKLSVYQRVQSTDHWEGDLPIDPWHDPPLVLAPWALEYGTQQPEDHIRVESIRYNVI